MFAEYKGSSTSVELSNTNSIAYARVGQGTTLTFQHDIPAGFEVKISGSTANHREIPDATADGGRIEALRQKGVVAQFDEFDTISGRGLHSVYGLALNGVKFELVAKPTKEAKESVPEDAIDMASMPEGAVEIETLDWNALRNLAKSLGVPAKMGTRREDVEKAISEKLSELAGPTSAAPVTVAAVGVAKAKITFAVK